MEKSMPLSRENKMEKEFSFEEAYSRLDQILEKMNSGKVSLDDSLKLYEEADKLMTGCTERLTQAEQKIETLIKNREAKLQVSEDGRPQTEPFATPHETTFS